MNPSQLASLICPDAVRRVARRRTREFLITAFKYSDGDFINVYTVTENGDVYLSDQGHTNFKLHVAGVQHTDRRRELIDSICELHHVSKVGEEFRKRIDEANPGSDVLSFCEAIARISNLEFGAAPRLRSVIPDQLETLINTRVQPHRNVYRKWTEPSVDPDGAYPVDYRMNSSGPSRHLFVVHSREKSTLVAAVSNFLLANGVNVPTMSVVDPEITLGRHQIDRLRLACTELRFGVSGYENSIVNFALGK